MEHLMSTVELEQFDDQIPRHPWLGCDHDLSYYPIVPFNLYPLVRGWTVEECADPAKMILRDPPRALQMLQSWLLFGTLESMIMIRFESQADIDAELKGFHCWRRLTADGEMVDFRILTAFAEAWSTHYLAMSGLSYEALRETYEHTMRSANGLTGYLVRFRDAYSDDDGVNVCWLEGLDSIVECTRLLLEALANAAPHFLLSENTLHWTLSAASATLIRARYAVNGWCPSTYKQLLRMTGSFSFISYASFFNATDPDEMKHNHCDESKCIANNLFAHECTPKHTGSHCRCPNLTGPLEEISRSIHGPSFPLLNIAFLVASQSTQLRDHPAMIASRCIVSYEPGTRYVAFSHVWSDGLMGTAETGLPACQISRLFNYARSLGISLIWLDALLIPEERQARKLAITRMSNVYQNASVTAVLDAGLSSSTGEEVGIKASLMRIMTSAWYKRLWTLQEAILSVNLAILFKEGFMMLPELLKLAVESPEHFEKEHYDPVHMVIVREIRHLSGLHINNLDIGKVSSMLAMRNSSRRGDESLAIAPLLGVDVRQLVELDAPARMSAFWRSVNHVPLNILTTDYPRLKETGSRALPSTMMGIETWLYLQPYDKKASVTTRGLEGEYWVGRLPTPLRLSAADVAFFRESEAQRSFCVWQFTGEGYAVVPAITFDAVCYVNKPVSQDQTRALTEYRGAALLKHPSADNTFSFMGLLNTDVAPPETIVQGDTIGPVEISASREHITVT
jgi:hypothetical protein